ncbi:MAG: trypsin-like peptidase domain-containing protein [Planctomycetes bacterium]|nr:trypsin-like peptidase domain-containing protein [Planctomycetota bacterium]MCB9935177.1 trypsin-like peptidase domain-containing protein [Planctomycetota bacterium]
MTRRMRPLLLAAMLTGMALAAAVATPFVGAEGKFETLKSLQTERRNFARAISPAVVAIAAEKPDFGASGQTGMAAGDAKATSGFVVDGDYVVTCLESGPLMGRGDDPYLDKGASVWMMAHDGTEFGGKVVGRDRRNLLLLVKMDEGHPSLPSMKLGDSDQLPMGSAVCGFGNTLDSLLIDRQISMTYGTVSGFYRFEPIDVMDPENENTGGDPYKGNVIEVDVAIHDGDHGGPIVNMKGEVVGMSCAHFMAGRHLGCAVPSNQIRAVLAQLKKGVAQDELAQGYLGFKAKKPTASRDIFISEIDPDGPAAKAGIKVGMQLVRVDNYRIPNWERLKEMLGVGYVTRKREVGNMFRSRTVDVPVSYGVPVGTHIQLTLRNPEDGREKTVDLVVGEKAEDF